MPDVCMQDFKHENVAAYILTLTLVFKASVKHSNRSEYRFLSHKVFSGFDSLSF